jgi:hypothetical protein
MAHLVPFFVTMCRVAALMRLHVFLFIIMLRLVLFSSDLSVLLLAFLRMIYDST